MKKKCSNEIFIVDMAIQIQFNRTKLMKLNCKSALISFLFLHSPLRRRKIFTDFNKVRLSRFVVLVSIHSSFCHGRSDSSKCFQSIKLAFVNCVPNNETQRRGRYSHVLHDRTDQFRELQWNYKTEEKVLMNLIICYDLVFISFVAFHLFFS